jgi:hypothetical protein
MNRSHLSKATTALANRLKAATVGFCITAALLCIIAVAQLTLLPQIVGAIEGFDNKEKALVVSALRRDWLTLHVIAVILVAIYWSLAAMLGRGQILQLRAANVTLALFILGVLALTLYSSFVQWPDELNGLCPLLGISDTDAPRFAFDAPSSCGAFIYAAHQIILLALLGIPIILLATSVIIRIASSRRARSANG